jgi:hypothetical protein
MGGIEASKQDDTTFFLKDQIMHLEDRDLVLELLYGRPMSSPPRLNPRESKRSTSEPQPRQQEREIHLDLREVQISAPSSADDDLVNFIRKLEFEDILQYVQIPRHPFHRRGASRSPADANETKPGEDGVGRRDFRRIFEVLKKKGVRKIIRLIVDDDDACLHQDDVIEELGMFEIEEFQWTKMDMSSVVLRHAVSRVRKLRLFSSGNHSVLRDWSGLDGLNQLCRVSGPQSADTEQLLGVVETEEVRLTLSLRSWKTCMSTSTGEWSPRRRRRLTPGISLRECASTAPSSGNSRSDSSH